MTKYHHNLLFNTCLLLFLLPGTSYAEQTLVFPASKIEPQNHLYKLDASRINNLELINFIKSEYLTTTLMDILKQPSKSCQESATTRKALDIFQNRLKK